MNIFLVMKRRKQKKSDTADKAKFSPNHPQFQLFNLWKSRFSPR